MISSILPFKLPKAAALLALCAAAIFHAGAACAQKDDSRYDAAVVMALYVGQASGVFVETQLARGRGGPLWAYSVEKLIHRSLRDIA